MRRINSLVSMAVMFLFLIHMIWGGLELAGLTGGGSSLFSVLSKLLLILLCVHILIGIVLTIETVAAVKKSGVFYWRQNLLFLVRRISGFALILFMVLHVLLFQGTQQGGVYRLTLFDLPSLFVNLLMLLSLLLHLVTNITPWRIALGLSDQRNLKMDIIFVLSVLFLLAGAAFLIYYLRWQVI